MVDGIQSLISSGHKGVSFIAHIGIPMWDEDTGHIVMIEQYHKGRHHEQKPGNSHPGVHQNSRCFVLLIHLFFVVNMVGSHFQDQSVVGSLASEGVESFGLVGA